MARLPAYREITAWLRREAERLGANALMPTIAEICDRFGVRGVQTVRNAYAPLIDEGIVERKGSPRRWVVVDHGHSPAEAKDTTVTLEALEQHLIESLELVRTLRHNQPVRTH